MQPENNEVSDQRRGEVSVPAKMDAKKKAKIIAIIVFVVLSLIVILQNTEQVETKFLFFSFTVSRALLLIFTFLFGLIVGMLLITYMYRRSK